MPAHARFVTILAAALAAGCASATCAPSTVVVEITESTAMADPERTERVLADLHTAGLRVAIDDFGTAYSSLSRLKELDINVLKIATPFVRDALKSSKAASLLTAIVRLAHAVGIEPLGEGIELEAQSRYLVQLGCRRGQGFFFSPPVPPHQIPALARRPLGRWVGSPGGFEQASLWPVGGRGMRQSQHR